MTRFARRIPFLGKIPIHYFDGAMRVADNSLARILNKIGQLMGGDGQQPGGIVDIGMARSWAFQTNTAIGFIGGCYEHASVDNDFSPSVSFGTVNVSYSAHVFVVTGAPTVDQLRIRVTGASINDKGVRVAGDTDDIVIPPGTPANSYFEAKKFVGQVTIEAVAGTPVACNYGWSKYYDANNQDFELVGLEALWESDSTDTTSDIELLFHRTTGWTFNGGAPATPPSPLASRAVDLGPDNANQVGCGAWKRDNLAQVIRGSDTEGILFRVASGSTGIGSLSYRMLNVEVTIRPLAPAA